MGNEANVVGEPASVVETTRPAENTENNEPNPGDVYNQDEVCSTLADHLDGAEPESATRADCTAFDRDTFIEEEEPKIPWSLSNRAQSDVPKKRLRAEAVVAPVTPGATRPRSRSSTPPPVDFKFSHSFLASLSMPGDKSVCDDGIALEGPAKLPIFGAAAAALPVPSSTAAMSPDFPDVRVCPAGEVLRTLPASVAYPDFRAACTCPEGHAMIRVVDGCDDDYLCPQCDDCSDQF